MDITVNLSNEYKHEFTGMDNGFNGCCHWQLQHLDAHCSMDMKIRLMDIAIKNKLSAKYASLKSYINMFSLCSFRLPECEPSYIQNFGLTKYFAVYAAKKYGMILGLVCLLHPPLIKLFSRFLKSGNNRNTQEYILLFRYIIGYIMEFYKAI